MIDPITIQQHPIVNGFFDVVRERFRLTKRETEVLKILSIQGSSNRELGEALCLSEKTMKNHVASIMKKLNVKSSREVQAVVFRDGLLPVFLNVFHTPFQKSEGAKVHASVPN